VLSKRAMRLPIASAALVLSLAGGCAKNCPCAKTPQASPESALNASGVSGAPSPAAHGEGTGLSGAATASAPAAGAPENSALPGGGEAESLPEVRLRNVGLHVGGGSNDEMEKEPFKRALEARFDEFLRCYRSAEEPAKGGTFGVDLFIARAGGKAQVRQPRTGIRGTEFRQCMIDAFSNVQFDKPKAGPTVISYSIKFELSS
jgi:hypothetical protein